MMAATVSECGRYRYLLSRRDDDLLLQGEPAVFCMLNPSTADAAVDDPTIRRCRGFARNWQRPGLQVVNLYALRSTDPSALWADPDPVGPDNDQHLAAIARGAGDIVCAWGAEAPPERVRAVERLFAAAGVRLWCLGTTKNGAPRHPLYVRGDAALIPWSR